MAEPAATAAPVNILLVDDQPEGLLALEAVLQDLGQNLVKARSGREALRKLLVQDFAVILLDIQMPDMDGYETAALLREKPSCRHTPIIFLTASHRADVQILQGYAVGAVDYIFKPLDPTVLRSKVAVFVELASQRELIQGQSEQLRLREQEARQLADSRAGLIVQLEQKNRELETVNRELESFSYSVSHDLRAPLRTIDGFSRALLEDCSDQLDESAHGHLERVRRATRRMSELIDDLLQLARVSRADLHSVEVNLSELAGAVAGELQRSQPERSVSFSAEDDLIVSADPRLMRVVLENLLGNAWKFTAKTAEPRVELAREQRDGATVYLVRDNGAGFDMSYSGKLFAAFQRLHDEKDFPGTGIGLATVRRVIDRHGGRVWLEGAVDRGATVFFTLPGSSQSAGSCRPPSAPSARAAER